MLPASISGSRQRRASLYSASKRERASDDDGRAINHRITSLQGDIDVQLATATPLILCADADGPDL
jgi:hypothetical protein